MEQLREYINAYQNDKEHNEKFYDNFTALTNAVPYLKEHRDYVEKNKLGFGDRAFHYMWYLLLNELTQKVSKPELLEIGVYKGQVISLWAILSRQLGKQTSITAISPLEGNFPRSQLINNRYVRRFLWLVNKKYRRTFTVGNNYLMEDYKKIIASLFSHFGEDLNSVTLHKGYSTNPSIVKEVSKKKFHLLYVDGDHSYEGALFDIKTYGPLVETGGYMVMDDASFYLEGANFWKGHEEVSKACDSIEKHGFRNVLNIGHNRVYQKI